MIPSQQTLIPQDEIKALAACIDDAKPWDIGSYRILLFYRKYFCTILSTFLALSVMPHMGVALCIILLVFTFDCYMAKHAYDQRLENSQLVHMMYETGDRPWIKKGQFKKYTIIHFGMMFILFLVAILMKLGVVPLVIGQYLWVMSFILLSMYSSYACIEKRLNKGLFDNTQQYVNQELAYGKMTTPISLFYSFFPNRIRRVLDAIFSTFMGFLLGCVFLAIMIRWVLGVAEMPWHHYLGLTIFASLVGVFSWIYPTRPFIFKCILIENFRIKKVKRQ
ncbi:MAG: hypothetical protein MK052_03925 [Alphaproteobacteria bacterium]|nr:hypothetical protein [Alphaproteobacteria bacterium]